MRLRMPPHYDDLNWYSFISVYLDIGCSCVWASAACDSALRCALNFRLIDFVLFSMMFLPCPDWLENHRKPRKCPKGIWSKSGPVSHNPTFIASSKEKGHVPFISLYGQSLSFVRSVMVRSVRMCKVRRCAWNSMEHPGAKLLFKLWLYNNLGVHPWEGTRASRLRVLHASIHAVCILSPRCISPTQLNIVIGCVCGIILSMVWRMTGSPFTWRLAPH